MSPIGIALTVIAGLLINELSELCPWLARRLVSWSARLEFQADAVKSAERAEELRAFINDCPGKLFKLIFATHFALVATRKRGAHQVSAVTSAGRTILARLRNPDVLLFTPVVIIYLLDIALIIMTGAMLAVLWIFGLYIFGALGNVGRAPGRPVPPTPRGVRRVLEAGVGIAATFGFFGVLVALGVAVGRRVVKEFGGPGLSGDLLSDIVTVDISLLIIGGAVGGSLFISEAAIRRLGGRRRRVN